MFLLSGKNSQSRELAIVFVDSLPWALVECSKHLMDRPELGDCRGARSGLLCAALLDRREPLGELGTLPQGLRQPPGKVGFDRGIAARPKLQRQVGQLFERICFHHTQQGGTATRPVVVQTSHKLIAAGPGITTTAKAASTGPEADVSRGASKLRRRWGCCGGEWCKGGTIFKEFDERSGKRVEVYQ